MAIQHTKPLGIRGPRQNNPKPARAFLICSSGLGKQDSHPLLLGDIQLKILSVVLIPVFLEFLYAQNAGAFQSPSAGTSRGPYRISLEMNSEKSSFRVGEPIPVSAKLWNASGFAIQCSEEMGGETFYEVRVLLPFTPGTKTPVEANLTRLGLLRRRGPMGLSGRTCPPIEPGAHYRPVSLDLAEHYDLKLKGQYRVVFSKMRANPMNPAEWIDVRSPELLFTIE